MKLLTIYCLVFLVGCQREKSDLDFGAIELKTGIEAAVPIILEKNQQKSPWRLRFRCALADFEAPSPTKKIVIYLKNNDLRPLIFTLDPDSQQLTIQPHEKMKIFDGTLAQLISLDRNMDEKMAFESSRERGINATLLIKSVNSTQPLLVEVSTFFYREGM